MHLEWSLDAESKVKILRTLLTPPFPQLDGAGLARETGRSQPWIYRILPELVASGVILRTRRGRTSFYAANPAHPLFEPMREAFRLEASHHHAEHLFPTMWNHLGALVADLVRREKDLAFVLLYGSLTRPPIYPESDVDLLLGTPSKRPPPEVAADVLGHPVSLVTMPAEVFIEKARARDPFVEGVLETGILLYASPEHAFPWDPAPHRGGPPRARRARDPPAGWSPHG